MDNEANSMGSEPNSGIPVQNKVPTTRRRPRRKKSLKPGEWIALIGALIPIVVALIPLILARFQTSPTPTLAPVSPPTEVFITDTPTPTTTSTPTLLPSSTVTDTLTASVTPSVTIEPSSTIRVIVVLVANRNTGKAPLNIRLDARGSYLLELNGTQLSCRGGPCFYTWKVYSNGQQIGRSDDNSSGTFEYTFGKNGVYTVSVWVCRGKDRIDCGGGGAQIVVSN